MKLIFCRFNTKTRQSEKKMKVNMERILFVSFIVTFVLMIFTQAAITNPSVRASLFINDELEGSPLAMEEFLYSRGEIVLQLVNYNKNEELHVLVNGKAEASFDSKSVGIKVKNGDVIEIDGTGIDYDIEVIIVSKSDNVVTECINKKVRVNSNIKRIAKVKVE